MAYLSIVLNSVRIESDVLLSLKQIRGLVFVGEVCNGLEGLLLLSGL